MMNSISTSRRLLRCAAGSQSYCLDQSMVDCVQRMENMYPTRGADGSVGWIRRGDSKIPVYRLTDQLGGNSGRGQGAIIVLRREDHYWGLLVDKIGSATEVPYERIFPLPAVTGNGNGRFPWVVADDAQIMLYLAPDRFAPAGVSGADLSIVPPVATPPPSNVRSAIQWRISSPPEPAPEPCPTAMVFTLVQQLPIPMRFALAAVQTLEIVATQHPVSVPHAPPFVKGLITWHSMPVPVIDLAAWLGIRPVRPESGNRLLICRGTAGRSKRDPGLLALAPIDDVRRLSGPFNLKPWPDPVFWNPALALGVYKQERSMLVIPDLDAILSFQMESSGYSM